MSDQEFFTLKYLRFHDEEGKKTNVSNPLIVGQRHSGRFFFLSFIMSVHLYQADPNCKHGRMAYSDCGRLPLDVDGIDSSISTQIFKNPYDVLFHLVTLDNGRKTDIGTLKKDKGDIFS